jgi:beta-galactosidase
MKKTQFLLLTLSIILMGSCSHKFDSNTLGLEFYQWNLWQDTGAVQGDDLPSCGWDDLHRGKGVLVRIPASLEELFPSIEGSAVFWYHCRFTLPEQWEGRRISMVFEHAGPHIKLFLNQEAAGSFQDEEGAFELDVSDVIYYTRDNHLAIRVSNSTEEDSWKMHGITGNILVKVKEN